MKDELGGKIMTEFVALRPKLYSKRELDGSEDKKCKGIKKCVVKKTLTFEDYKTCLFSDSTEYRSQLMFRSAKHEVHTIEVNKVALNRDDDKRISKKDGISTFSRGHKDLSWSPILGDRIFTFYVKIFTTYKMEVLKLKEFNPDKLKAVISKKGRYGQREFTSVRFSYDGSDVPAIRVDGSFGLFDFNSDGKVTYSLAIKCENNEDSFQELCRVLLRESSKITNVKQNFELVKETKSGSKVVYGKI